MGKCEQCIVRELSSLKALSKNELVHLADCKDTHLIKKGEVIFNEGDVINGVYCIKEGICKLVKMNSNGKDTILKLITKGELLGQTSILTQEKATLSAIAVEDMHVCFIPKTEILSFIDNNRNFSLEVTKDVCQNLNYATDFAINHTHKTVKERLALALLSILDSAGTDHEGYLNLQLSREEIASMVGTATESCIRLLSELKKAGIIDLKGKRIKINNIQNLKNLAQ
ncbi:cAMP-binding domain of CRP or a regulatory subunit of cAMP-dependent protein kinases [Paenimyroides aquimaris]|uniref:cAMP-binding domain of CRP or a regulatory subunit of cAMP-dependent protein kinases n=1 Tax=Paenimyroides marinum TaxID=1159016 RepID=A0A1H6K5P6_9FLAO|nr:Crp/Fnr family transcriptional regulator [Paenimyroides aquimaris]SEH66793.1 cAMP-binding domain of CRP or a regulatory subunit of cAMP-dependent protein kinases [Paenimyroides aquimaris]